MCQENIDRKMFRIKKMHVNLNMKVHRSLHGWFKMFMIFKQEENVNDFPEIARYPLYLFVF